MSMCIKCHQRKAELPDRESGSRVKRVCKHCHAELLRGDLRRIVASEQDADREMLGSDTDYFEPGRIGNK